MKLGDMGNLEDVGFDPRYPKEGDYVTSFLSLFCVFVCVFIDFLFVEFIYLFFKHIFYIYI